MSIMRVVKKFSQQSGAASLIVTIILMMAVVSIVGTLTVITLRDVRQSGDLDQSSRALNAAQAGLQDLVSKVNADPEFEQTTCNGNTSGSGTEKIISDPNSASGQDLAITCATVNHAGTTAGGFMLRDQGITFDLSNAHETVTGSYPPQKQSNYDSVVYMGLRWNDTSTDVTDYNIYENTFYKPTGTDSSRLSTIDFPELDLPKAAHPRGEPASIELIFSWCPRLSLDNTNPNFTKCNYTPGFLNANGGEPTFTTVIRPGYPNANPYLTSDCNHDMGFITNLACQAPRSIVGDASTTVYGCGIGQRCSVPMDLSKVLPFPPCPTQAPQCFNGNPNHDKFIIASNIIKVKIKARYSSTRFNVNFGNFNAKNVYFTYPFAQLDVTARSGDIYRRVTGTRFTSFTSYSFLDTALFSGTNICKNLTRYRGSGGPSNQQNNCALGN